MRANQDPNKAPTWTTQLECDVANALREYEAAHRVWMNTPVWHNEDVKQKLAIAREKHTQAVKALHPDWVVI